MPLVGDTRRRALGPPPMRSDRRDLDLTTGDRRSASSLAGDGTEAGTALGPDVQDMARGWTGVSGEVAMVLVTPAAAVAAAAARYHCAPDKSPTLSHRGWVARPAEPGRVRGRLTGESVGQRYSTEPRAGVYACRGSPQAVHVRSLLRAEGAWQAWPAVSLMRAVEATWSVAASRAGVPCAWGAETLPESQWRVLID